MKACSDGDKQGRTTTVWVGQGPFNETCLLAHLNHGRLNLNIRFELYTTHLYLVANQYMPYTETETCL